MGWKGGRKGKKQFKLNFLQEGDEKNNDEKNPCFWGRPIMRRANGKREKKSRAHQKEEKRISRSDLKKKRVREEKKIRGKGLLYY